MATFGTNVRGLTISALRKLREDGPFDLLRSVYGRCYQTTVSWTATTLSERAIDRSELIERCEEQTRVVWYGQSETVEIYSPLGGDAPEEFAELVGEHSPGRDFVCELGDARIVGPDGITQSKSGRLVVEPMGTKSRLETCLRETIEGFGLVPNLRLLARTVLPGGDGPNHHVAISLIPRHGRDYDDVNYGHWLSEDLPKIRAIVAYTEETGREPTVILRQNPPEWMLDTLRLLGLSEEDWVELDYTATVERLLVPKQNYVHSWGSEISAEGKRWVGEQMRSNVDVDAVGEDFSEYVYVSRQGMDRRRVGNAREVMEVLEPLGFEAYRPEELSIPEQVALFAEASVIVGSHGSGLMNMIWAADASLVEILPPETRPTVFFQVANECGLGYDFVHGTAPTDRSGHKNADVVVDTENLETAVRRAIAHEQDQTGIEAPDGPETQAGTGEPENDSK